MKEPSAASDAHCEQNAITETSQRGLGYQSGEPAGAVNSGSAPANAAMTPKKALRTQYGQGLADGFRITLRLFLGEPQAGAAPYTGPRTPESEAWARAALNRDPEALS